MIITIGRQHGSNGHAVAQALADRLGIPCYSKEIVDRTARDSNFSKDVIRSYDEKRVSPFAVPGMHLFGMDEGFRLNMQIASAQFDTIRTLAEEGDAVFVGRCADYVLRSRSDLVRVFVMADMPYRVHAMMERKNLSEDQANFGIFRKNCALILSLFLEIHRVFLRNTVFIRTQFFSKSALAELCGIALKKH